MFKNKNFVSTIILVIGVSAGLLYFLYQNYNTFINSNLIIAIVTLLVGGIAIILYLTQKHDNKTDAARTVLQEIGRAEKIISDYKEHGHFKFTKKIIVINSWAKNIHYFIKDMPFEKLDKISDLYSTGEYLDSIIKMVSDVKFDERLHEVIRQQAKKQVDQQLLPFLQKIDEFSQQQIPTDSKGSTLGNAQGGFGVIPHKPIPNRINIQVNLTINSVPTDMLFNEIVSKYEPIYNTDIVSKLKEIAKLK